MINGFIDRPEFKDIAAWGTLAHVPEKERERIMALNERERNLAMKELIKLKAESQSKR